MQDCTTPKASSNPAEIKILMNSPNFTWYVQRMSIKQIWKSLICSFALNINCSNYCVYTNMQIHLLEYGFNLSSSGGEMCSLNFEI